jgi:succinate dehydrogenase/fumarate reductase cytochrome b subunit
MEKIFIVGFLVLIVYNLVRGCYFMLTDKGQTDATVRSLSWRIGLSLLLIALIGAGIKLGYIHPHGVNG